LIVFRIEHSETLIVLQAELSEQLCSIERQRQRLLREDSSCIKVIDHFQAQHLDDLPETRSQEARSDGEFASLHSSDVVVADVRSLIEGDSALNERRVGQY
jgi:hypothetical protein